MRQSFYRTISRENLWNRQDKLLLAVSGGVDSMVLLDLCSHLHNEIGIAHCNFQLRGEASDADENLVIEEAKRMGVFCESTKFDTIGYAQEKGVSIEMAARTLRYDFFQHLLEKKGYTKILTAHHANDNAETLLLNLIKGTGIKGLTGIPTRRENIVRPFLHFKRKDLVAYAMQNHIRYREDATNKEVIYQRNKIRHEVIPLLETLNPAVVETLNENIQRFQEVRKVYEEVMQRRLQFFVQEDSIDIEKLKNEPYRISVLYEWLSVYDFPRITATEVSESLEHQEEKVFYAPAHRLVKSRNKLYLTPYPLEKEKEYAITLNGITVPIRLSFTEINPPKKFSKHKDIAYFDLEKLSFPLILRKWQEGDRFFPIGMKGSKKVSELFKDLKYSILQKEGTWLLCSGEEIIWVVGARADDRFRIMKNTTRAIKVVLQP